MLQAKELPQFHSSIRWATQQFPQFTAKQYSLPEQIEAAVERITGWESDDGLDVLEFDDWIEWRKLAAIISAGDSVRGATLSSKKWGRREWWSRRWRWHVTTIHKLAGMCQCSVQRWLSFAKPELDHKSEPGATALPVAVDLTFFGSDVRQCATTNNKQQELTAWELIQWFRWTEIAVFGRYN